MPLNWWHSYFNSHTASCAIFKYYSRQFRPKTCTQSPNISLNSCSVFNLYRTSVDCVFVLSMFKFHFDEFIHHDVSNFHILQKKKIPDEPNKRQQIPKTDFFFYAFYCLENIFVFYSKIYDYNMCYGHHTQHIHITYILLASHKWPARLVTK